MRSRWRAPAALVLALVVATACGKDSGDDQSGVASLDKGAGEASASAAPKDREQALLDFAKCMRENGFDMPDPNPDGPIMIGPGMAGGQPSEASARKFDEAHAKCRQHIDGVIGGGSNGSGGGPPPQIQEALLKMAQCMRDNGFAVSDPQFGNGGQFLPELPEGVDPSDPKFQAAQTECREQAGLTGMGGPS